MAFIAISTFASIRSCRSSVVTGVQTIVLTIFNMTFKAISVTPERSDHTLMNYQKRFSMSKAKRHSYTPVLLKVEFAKLIKLTFLSPGLSIP